MTVIKWHSSSGKSQKSFAVLHDFALLRGLELCSLGTFVMLCQKIKAPYLHLWLIACLGLTTGAQAGWQWAAAICLEQVTS